MADNKTFPHWQTNVIDRSIYTPLIREQLPSLRPIFFARTQQGPVGVPVWVESYTAAKEVFGEGTFDADTQYYSREALFMSQLFARQGCFITRMVSSQAQYGSMVLELQVKLMDVPQYSRDADGYFIMDELGNKVPLVDPDTGATVMEPGAELKWTTRPMVLEGDRVESLKNLRPVTYQGADGEYTVYPMLAMKASSVGAYANDMGVKLWVNLDDMDFTLANAVQSILYSIGVVKKTYGQDTVSPVFTTTQDKSTTFVVKPEQKDARVDRRVSFDDIIDNSYSDLPFDITVYHENFATVGAIIQDLEYDDDTLTDPYLVNLTEPYNIEGVPYPHVVLSEEEDSLYLNDTRILYMKDGADGDISDSSIEALTVQYLKDRIYPELFDQARYPFTHLFDTGVSIDTKKAFISLMGYHDAFKVILSTQDANMGRFNTKAEDLSMGASLYAAALLQPESIEKGTEACRCEIYQQAGLLNNSTYKGIVCSTLDIMLKKSLFMSTGTITGQAAGLPLSIIEIFKPESWNWTPCDDDHKQQSWDTGLNYFQYYDMTGVHWPAMRTVYRYDTSVLMNALFTDIVIFTKHLARYNWARFVGREEPFSILGPNAEAALANDIGFLLGNIPFKYEVSYQQSAEEARIGYISHAYIKIWGGPQHRVTIFDIECYRDGFDPTAEV